MLELAPTEASVIGCLAAPEGLDALMGSGGAFPCRIARDEAMLVCEKRAASDTLVTAAAQVTAADPDALVLDLTDGWSVWTLVGDSAREAFARLSEIPLEPDGVRFVQGAVAGVPARAIALPDRLHLLVPAMFGEYLRQEILAACSDLGARERSEPTAWAPPAAARPDEGGHAP